MSTRKITGLDDEGVAVRQGRRHTISRRTLLGGAAAFGTAAIGGIGTTSAMADGDRKVILAAHGRARAVVVTPLGPDDFEARAAAEISHYIEMITGARLPIMSDPAGRDEVRIFVGRACPDPQLERIEAPDRNGDSFRLDVSDDAVQLVCLPGGRGAMYAAYELLEQIGVRWLMPGASGTFVPDRAVVTATTQDRVEVPGYSGRVLQPVRYTGDLPDGVDPLGARDWMRRRRFAGPQIGRHGIPLSPPASRSTEPELFMHVDGRMTNKLDVSHPEVLTRAIRAARETLADEPGTDYISLGPTDGLGFGVTEWDADDVDPLTGAPSVTDRYVKFCNLILEDLQADYPDVGIAFYAYSAHSRAPVREVPHPRFLPVFAPIAIDRLHSAADPAGNERRYFFRMIERWRELGVDWAYRGYSYNLADPGMPFSALRQVAVEHPRLAELGASAAFRVEGLHSWGHDTPAYNLMSKLMWDPEQAVEPIVDEFFDTAYGGATAQMRRYFDRLHDAFTHSDLKTGNMYDFPDILTESVLGDLDSDLSAAEQASARHGEAAVAERIAITRKAFDYGRTHLEAVRAWRRFDFSAAKAGYDRALLLADEAASTEPVAIYPFRRWYLTRFWQNQFDQAVERSSGPNEIVARAPDSWPALLDSDDTAETDEVWAAGVDTSTWLPLATVSKTWSGQGLRYYKGTVWYRCELSVPVSFQGREIRLWLGTVDEAARAWMNGHELTRVGGGGSLGPWEFDASEFVRFDQHNEVSVQVTNRVLDELGTGGLMGPAFLWAGGQNEAASGDVEPRTRTVAPTRPVPPATADAPGDADWRVRLPETWDAHVDPFGSAAELGLWEPQLPTTSWLRLQTSEAALSEQGFAYYRGGMVYRTEVSVPRRRVTDARLWISAADGRVTAWFNEHVLDLVQEGSDTTAWEFALPESAGSDAPGAVTVAVGADASAARPAGVRGPIYIYQPR